MRARRAPPDAIGSSGVGAHGHTIEHRGDRGCRLEADLALLKGCGRMRMPGGQALAAERLALCRRPTHRDESRRLVSGAARGRRDESGRVVEPLHLREAGVAELGTRST